MNPNMFFFEEYLRINAALKRNTFGDVALAYCLIERLWKMLRDDGTNLHRTGEYFLTCNWKGPKNRQLVLDILARRYHCTANLCAMFRRCLRENCTDVLLDM